MNTPLHHLRRLFPLVGLLALAATMSLNFVIHSRDFTVFWKTARYVLAGEPAYSVARDGAWVFKYPPWTLPFFLPFGLLPLEMARIAWALTQLGAFAYVLRWTARACASPGTFFTAAILFWGLWQVNAMDGQVSLLLLAAWLWAGSPNALENLGVKSAALLGVSLTKVFTAYPLLAFKPSWKAAKNALLAFGLVLAPLSLPGLWVAENHSPSSLMNSYVEAMLSGGKLLDYDGVRGRYNQGLTGLALRTLGVPPENTTADLLCFLALGSLLALLWHRLSRHLRFELRWAGWIALTPVVHPLPYWYSFVLTFPLAALSLGEAVRSKSRLAVGLSGLGIAMIAVITGKTLGSVGTALELLSIKSWGVLLCCLALAVIPRASARSSGS